MEKQKKIEKIQLPTVCQEITDSEAELVGGGKDQVSPHTQLYVIYDPHSKIMEAGTQFTITINPNDKSDYVQEGNNIFRNVKTDQRFTSRHQSHFHPYGDEYILQALPFSEYTFAGPGETSHDLTK